MTLLEGLDGLNPNLDCYLNFDTLKPLIERYEKLLSINKIEIEMELLKYHCTKDTYGFQS